MVTPDDLQPSAYPVNGMFVHGLLCEGARWASPAIDDSDAPSSLQSGVELVHGTRVGGNIADSRLKELLAPMNVLYLEAVPILPQWIPASVGLLRNDPQTYDCPVYSTTFRGNTCECTACERDENIYACVRACVRACVFCVIP